MLVVCGLQPSAASAAALFGASSSAAFCLASASAAECIICGSKKISYNCNYKCKQIAMLVVCALQPAAASAAALFKASSSAAFFFCSSSFRFTSATSFIIYCGKKVKVSILDKK
jgi:Trk-type K+ transport system membrane component